MWRLPFACVHCRETHSAGEPGFRLPDRASGLDVIAREEDSLEINGTSFVRGELVLPIRGGGSFGIKLWVQLSRSDRTTGHIANQADFLGPTLGVPVRLESDARIRVSVADNPLARAQRDGVDRHTVVHWMSDEVHADEPRPGDRPFGATLDTHGWELMEAFELGGLPAPLVAPPRAGDTVKVGVRFLATDARGIPSERTAGWWVRLADVSRPDAWSGTLAHVPHVPTTLRFGAPMWVRPEHVLEHASDQSRSAASLSTR